jgi:serine/threonine-protein kinase RsbW
MRPINKKDPDQVVIQERITPDILKIGLKDGVDPNQIIPTLHAVFDQSFRDGISQIIFDMENVEFPNGSFIAMLIGRTMQVRRSGGDIKIIHLSERARDHISMFTPLTYLSIGTDAMSIVKELTGSYPMTGHEFGELEEGEPKSLQVDAIVEDLEKVTHFVSVMAEQTDMDPIEISKLKIAVYEACMNVIEHGYEFRTGEFIGIEVLKNKKRLSVTIIDRGPSFALYKNISYDVKAAFEEKRQGGFGLYIIKRSVDEIKYEKGEDGRNRLTLVKKIK